MNPRRADARAGVLALLLASAAGSAQTPPAPAPAAHPPAAHPPAPRRLDQVLAAAEKAAAEGRRAEALERLEQATALVAGRNAEDLRTPEAVALLERLRTLELALQGPARTDPGLKVEEEVVALSGEDLRTQMERVAQAEAGATFDFPIDLNDKVVTWVREFTSTRRGFIEKSLGRSMRYMPMVRQIFTEEGVPGDLGYLAVIESGFQNHARSYAAAVGMWQFIRSTGRIYGLKGSAWVEERRDPVKSARASARYLRRLYEISGDWYLALVGYNAGPLTTERAVANVGSRNFWDLHRSRWLRNQTKNYVPEILAAILIGKNPERYGLTVVAEPPFAFETVQVDRMTSLAVLSRTAAVPVEALKDLNPELLRGSTPPGTYPLRVPPGFGAPAARALAGLTPAQRLDFKDYTVRKGDTLARVAARFSVTSEDLLAANDLQPRQFRTGLRIKVPPRSALPIATADLREGGEPRPLPDRPLEVLPGIPSPGRPLEPAVAAPRPDPVPVFVIADEADTLARIASVHGYTRDEVAAANPGLSERPGAGTRVRLPEGPPAPPPVPATHRVKKGDTLFSVARQYGLDPADLKAWNRLGSSAIKPGQRLRLSPP